MQLTSHQLWLINNGKMSAVELAPVLAKRADFSSQHFDPKHDWNAAVLPWARFVGTTMHSARCQWVDFENGDFTSADLRWCRFWNAKLRGAVFKDARLLGADFTNADLRNCRFENSDLRLVYWGGADITATEFINCRFSEGRSSPSGVAP